MSALGIEDRLAISDLVLRYLDAVNRSDREAWVGTWTEDATWTITAGTVEGRTRIEEKWLGAMGSLDRVVQMHGGNVIEADPDDPDAAIGRVYFSEEIWRDGERAMSKRFVYDDRYRRTGDGWRFASRALSEAGIA